MGRIFCLALSLFAVLASSPVSAWPQGEAQIGAQNHPKFLAQQGGEIKEEALSRYVRQIGQRIVAHTPLAHERWVFTVTDTPVVNAFAAPGGYVYITRGLLALANSEAELAAVIGHEVAHLTASHHSKRQKRGNDAGIGVLVGTVLGGILGGKDGLKKGIELSSKVAAGYVGQFSQAQEFEADQLGTRYLAAAGYNPLAQAAILNALGAKRAFEAKKSGKEYNPNRVDFFATHPATQDRVNKARQFARGFQKGNRIEAEEPYMAAIDGMVYGDSASQGFVRGKTFQHPEIGFEYSVPDNFTITNSANRIVSTGPNGAQFNLDSGGAAANVGMGDYFRGVWVVQFRREVEVGRLGQISQFSRNGVNGAHAILPYKRNGADWLAHLTLIEHRGRYIRLTGMVRAQDRGMLRDFDKAAATFRALTDGEAAQMKPYRLRSYRVRADDTVDWLSLASPSQHMRRQLFMTLNGLEDQNALIAGDMVKVVTE